MTFFITKLFLLFKVMHWTTVPWWWAAIFALSELALNSFTANFITKKIDG